MAGTKAGAAKTKAKLLEKDPEFYAKLSVKGGAATKGRKQTDETKRKISETKRRISRENHETPAK